MITGIQSIRPFIGSKDFGLSRSFYRDFGFTEVQVAKNMSYFYIDQFGFYLQDAYVKDWVDNSMLFLEVSDLPKVLAQIKSLDLTAKYPQVRISKIHHNDWGNEFFVHDPFGILWHIGQFNKK